MKLILATSLLSLLTPVQSLNNGLGLSPQMGWASWNDCASQVTSSRIKNATLALINTGLAAKGYEYVNVDEGWLKGRSSNGDITVIDEKFPEGMKALGDFIHDHGLKYGLYTSRGTVQCSTAQYNATGSQGYEVQDANWLVSQGMDYLKEDSCGGGPNNPTDAFTDYATMRDALNATGRSVFFSLCGWYTWYAPSGDSLGNSWRISGDGTNWGALTQSINANVELGKYARPGAWNDPDLLVGTGIGSNRGEDKCFDGDTEIPQSSDWYMTNDEQSRAQFTMWCIMSSPLIISANLNQVSEYALETWGNEEAIAVNQHFRTYPEGTSVEDEIYQGIRIFGDDMEYDKSTDKGSGVNVWAKPLEEGKWALVFLNNEDEVGDVTCDSECFEQLYDLDAGVKYTVRDLWEHEDEEEELVADEEGKFEYTAEGLARTGGVKMILLTPVD